MRIISGRAKGKRLYSPKGKAIRPTADRVKESIFDILGDRWEGLRVLDLFSGTGSLGLEAISRGAQEVVFVENARPALDLLRKNISLCGFDSCATVMAMPVTRGLRLMGQRGESFGVIFADPPYGRGCVEKTIRVILKFSILSLNGVIVMEHAPYESPERDQGELITLTQRRYGDTTISFFGFGTENTRKPVKSRDNVQKYRKSR
ncbi:MAG: 16S rRNA (guanine(966)-N(2))-methyltransferase RsmD [Proteobacteria bacterium]|nr:16S rRNA (guanine(966)-N(2))-methyltransferase RsmD [Pseudomonadota bacterium]NIS71583.1 16S rRNA (guanine(966)-N(2))-methyltransferase RsmD [Pseudomonadota bacterium]